MSLKVLIYAKFFTAAAPTKILFALSADGIPVFNIERKELDLFIQQNFLIRKTEFDYAVNKQETNKFLIEWPQVTSNAQLPKQIEISNKKYLLDWYLFPIAVKKIQLGKDKNLLQLAVQFISNGGIDQSVIAADFDEAFIKTLQKNLKDS